MDPCISYGSGTLLTLCLSVFNEEVYFSLSNNISTITDITLQKSPGTNIFVIMAYSIHLLYCSGRKSISHFYI